MRRRIAWLVVLGLAATVMSLVFAPQLLRLGAWMAQPLPAMAADILKHLAYEIGLWGPALGIFLGTRRFGWLKGRIFATALVMFPATVEMTFLLTIGWEAGFASVVGICTRLVVGGGAIFVAVRQARPKATPP